MYRSSELVANARARWLAELAEALDKAELLADDVDDWRPDNQETADLRVRILAVRAELDDLRRSGLGEVRREVGPDWTNLASWRGNLPDQAKI